MQFLRRVKCYKKILWRVTQKVTITKLNWYRQAALKVNKLIYEVCLKSNDTVHAARTICRREKSIAFYDITMSYGFENQISAFCDNYILFCTCFCQGTFFVTVLQNLIKLRIFGFFFGTKDKSRTTNQLEISCPSWKNSN